MRHLITFLAGVIFGTGIALSGMAYLISPVLYSMGFCLPWASGGKKTGSYFHR